MGLKFICNVALLLAGLSVKAQVHPDKVFMGIKGPVKQFTSTTYKDIISREGTWMPEDTANFSITYTCYFNRNGWVDSMHLWYRKPSQNTETGQMENAVVHERIISEIKKGKKTGSLIYSNSTVIRREQNVRSDSATTIENTLDAKGKLTYSTQTLLSASLCPETNIFISYDSLGNEIYKKVQRWTRDENCNVSRVREETGETIVIYKYVIQKFSKAHHFPLETWVIREGEKKPEKMVYRTVEFY